MPGMSFIRRTSAAVLTAVLSATMLAGTASAVEFTDKQGNKIGLIQYDKGDRTDPELENQFEWITCTLVGWSMPKTENGKRMTRDQYAQHLRETNQLPNALTFKKLPFELLNIKLAEDYAKRAEQCNLVDPNPKPILPALGSASSKNPSMEAVSSTLSGAISSKK